MRCGGWGVLLLSVLLAAALAKPLDDCPPCPPHTACLQTPNAFDECLYKVDNKTETLKIVLTKKYFGLTCPEGVTLDSSSLPRYARARLFPEVTLIACPLPAEPLAHALSRLSVRPNIDTLLLLDVPPTPLRADHFQHLPILKKLVIKNNSNLKLTVAKENITLFDPLITLTNISLTNVRLPSGVQTFQNLTKLESLQLSKCKLLRIQRNHLCKLPLKTLSINDETLIDVRNPEVPCNMSEVTLIAPRLKRVPTFHAATSLVLRVSKLQKLQECSLLVNLTVIYNGYAPLPEGWLSACGLLRRLTLSLPNSTEPLGALLAGLADLNEFKLINSPHVQLTEDLFATTRKISILNLSNNKFTELPTDIFSPLTAMEELDLSHNRLSAVALKELTGLTRLRRLWLQGNPLGDLCRPQPVHERFIGRKLSVLHQLSGLQQLSLARTGATRVCRDWRRHDFPDLKQLYLEYNDITELEWDDLQDWNQDVEVNLDMNNLTTVRFTRDDYSKRIAHSDRSVKFIIGIEQPLRCDCNMYWFAKAMKDHFVPAQFEGIYCKVPSPETDNRIAVPLGDFDINLMVCRRTHGCPTGCSCVFHNEDENILVECSNSGIGILPNITALEGQLPNKITLRVNGNNISVLPEEIGARVSEVDLRNNSLAMAGRVAARALLAGGRRVRLAGNPLRCNCTDPLLRELSAHFKQIMDLEEARCDGGQSLSEAMSLCVSERGGPGVAWLAGGAGAVLLLAGGVALALKPHVRLRLKAFLLARGLCLRWVQPTDDDVCKYDAFLSYAHEDSEVAAQLLAELECGPRALRLCVHHRDWRAGEWIPKQIAESVKESRRTIILLSENYAKSSWARAEFREAYAHMLRDNEVRLVVVLLGEAPPAELDPDIQHYVANNTYVRWGEPAFYEKLRLALPVGRLRPPLLATKEKETKPWFTKAKTASTPKTPASPTAASVLPRAPRASRRPPPLRTDPPVHPATPQPPTPIVKFAHIDFPAPVKPVKAISPACA